MSEVNLVVGLGNPGREYQKTRHNLGFMAVEALAGQIGAEFKKCRYASALVGEARDGEKKIVLALPQTYMNNSGLAVRAMVAFDRVDVGSLIVVCDDIHLPFGEMRLRAEGSDGGHNGLSSVIEHLGTSKFMRLRLGVGEPPAAERQVEYVLSDFNKEEKARLAEFLEDAASCLKLWLTGDTAKAMTQYNKRKGNG